MCINFPLLDIGLLMSIVVVSFDIVMCKNIEGFSEIMTAYSLSCASAFCIIMCLVS